MSTRMDENTNIIIDTDGNEVIGGGCIPLLVSPRWLKSKLDSNPDPSGFLVLDVTWIPLQEGRAFYLDKHIPGAVHFDLNAGVTPSRLIPRNLPESNRLERYMRSLGINTRTHVVVYDRDDIPAQVCTLAAYRVWWLLKVFGHTRVSILNGGLLNWELQGYATSSQPPSTLPEGDFEQRLSTSYVQTYDSMMTQVEDGGCQVVDTRLEDNFTGQLPEPSDFSKLVIKDSGMKPLSSAEMQGGHMPGAINLPFPQLVDVATSCLLDQTTLTTNLTQAGINLQKPLIATCYIGHSACCLALVAELLGCPEVSVYYGSWTEWGQRAPQRFCVKN